jgi:hypothetical protein
VPYLAVALFGLIFAYFTNAGGLRRVPGWKDTGRSLAVQRRFLERAVMRLIGPRAPALEPRRRRTAHGS